MARRLRPHLGALVGAAQVYVLVAVAQAHLSSHLFPALLAAAQALYPPVAPAVSRTVVPAEDPVCPATLELARRAVRQAVRWLAIPSLRGVRSGTGADPSIDLG